MNNHSVTDLEKMYNNANEKNININHSDTDLEKIHNNGMEKIINITKKEIHTKQRSPFKKQALIAFGVFMLNLGAGATAGISAILIPQLKETLGKHTITSQMESWIAAISSMALVFGNLTSGYLMERFGRRKAQLMLSTCFTTAWIIIASSNIMGLILFGRFITGFCQGWLGPLGPVFVGEISSPSYRGLFLAALSLGIALGVLLSHLFGTFLHWSYAALLCGLFPLIGGITIYYAPESPAWLASKNKIEDCILSFQWYRGKSVAMKTELDKMIAEQSKKDNTKGKLETLRENIKKPEFWKPLGIMTVFFIVTQLSGVNVICAYTTDMMAKLITGKKHDKKSEKHYAYVVMLCIDMLRCISLVIACILLRKSGRRPMAIFSGVFTSLSLIVLAIYLYLDKINVIKTISPFISLGLMAFYIVVSNMGISPLPWNMVGELFAVQTKGLGSGISVMMTSIAFFGTVKTAPAMFHSIGHHGTYLFYGISTLLGTIFLYFCLPETKEKTLLQIEEYFRYGKKKPPQTEVDNNMKESKSLMNVV